MARVDAILKRLLQLHPTVIDLSLERLERLLGLLNHPERALPPIVHVAGTNGKGSTIAFMRAILEAAGRSVHVYTSPHLVQFKERIYLGDTKSSIDNAALSELLEECEDKNGGAPITFFEITTAAAFLAFARHQADYLLLETGLGGRLDATNVIEQPRACVITPIDLDHQQFLGDMLTQISFEKAGIMKPGVPCIVGPQQEASLAVLEQQAEKIGAPLHIAEQDWQVYQQHGRLVYQSENELLDLPLPNLIGQHQIINAGMATATLRRLDDPSINADSLSAGLTSAEWPARLEKLSKGHLHEWAPPKSEIFLDGGHNPAAGKVIALELANLNDHHPRPLVLIVGMLNSKDPIGYFEAFADMASVVFTIPIPQEANTLSGEVLENIARQAGLQAHAKPSIEAALDAIGEFCRAPRILIGGSLYLAGHVLALHAGLEAGKVSGT